MLEVVKSPENWLHLATAPIILIHSHLLINVSDHKDVGKDMISSIQTHL